MPAGIERSPYNRPIADAIGWSLGKLRALLNRNGYEAPYLDERRILKILADNHVDIRPYLDKTKHPPDFLNPRLSGRPPGAPAAPTAPANELILAQPPSPLDVRPTQLPSNTHFQPLIVRLAKLLGGTGPEHQAQARSILKDAGIDGRTKDEDKVLKIFVSKGISIEGFERRDDTVHSLVMNEPDVDRLPVAELRDYAKSLQRQNAELEQENSKLHGRHKRMQQLMETGKHKLIEDIRAGRKDDFSVTETLLLFARDEARNKP